MQQGSAQVKQLGQGWKLAALLFAPARVEMSEARLVQSESLLARVEEEGQRGESGAASVVVVVSAQERALVQTGAERHENPAPRSLELGQTVHSAEWMQAVTQKRVRVVRPEEVAECGAGQRSEQYLDSSNAA